MTKPRRPVLKLVTGKSVYLMANKEILWVPEVAKVAEPAKPRRMTCIEMLNALDGWTPQSSVRRTSIRMTDVQEDIRLERNSSWRKVRSGKRVAEKTVAKIDGCWQEVTVMATKIISIEYVHHDSHGKHGRKPAYKQFATRRPKE